MKKNGFIATSILYTFFIIFLSLFVALIANYMHNRLLITKINSDSRDKVLEINNMKLTNIKIGEHIRFTPGVGNTLINENGVWTLAYREETEEGTVKLSFLSDLTVPNEWVYTRTELITNPGWHGLTIDHYEYINPSDATRTEFAGPENYYDTALLYPGFKIRIPTIKDINKIRTQPGITEDALESIMHVGGEYLIKSGEGFDKYEPNVYYMMRAYSFPVDFDNTNIQKYCNATVDENKQAAYPATNPAGYLNIVRATLTSERYANYCYYASPTPYSFNAADGVVDITTIRESDKVETNNIYKMRYLAEIEVDPNNDRIYLAGGKGSLNIPYEFENGVKIS